MSTIRNKVQLIGNVGKEPEIVKNGNGERITDTQWHNIIAWGKTAELVEKYVGKGKEVGVEGKLTNRSWDDKDGNKRYITEIVCNELLLLGQK